MKALKQAQERGYLQSRSNKLHNPWYNYCKGKRQLFIHVKDGQKYSFIHVDTWGTPYNFSDLGISRLKEAVQPYWEKVTKKNASMGFGASCMTFYGFPKEDAPAIAEKIIEIWETVDSKEKAVPDL